MNRRVFLKRSAVAMFGVGAAPAWLARAAASDEGRRSKKVLVAIFQRGAADGLNIVVPHGDKRYYELRPSIAVPRPGASEAAAIDLDGFFGLHPAMSPLKPIYDAGRLAIVEAAGSPDPTRSHFDAQDYMESGTPGRKSTPDGWLNRALTPAEGKPSPVRGVSLGQKMPRALRGRNPAVAINTLKEFQVREKRAAMGFEDMYRGGSDATLAAPGKDTFEAVKLLQSIENQSYTPANGAAYPNGRFGQSLKEIARLIKSGVGVEVAFADIGGWDHHVNEVGQNANEGQLPGLLREFAGGLAAFHQDMGDLMADVVVVTMSEFGRTAAENGNRGTDHGHANLMFAMGGGIRGGKVYGEWPGLEREQLHEGRDLRLTTDFRDVLAELVTGHLGNRDAGSVFPGFAADAKRFRGLLKA